MNQGVIRKTIFREIGTDQDSGSERKTVIIFLFILYLF
jgi:hypothetical protein